MDDTKYGKYIIRDSYHNFESMNSEAFFVDPESLGAPLHVAFHGISEPIVFGEGKEPHRHDFHQILFFLGGDSSRIHEFDADIDVFLGRGEDQEKHTVTSPTVINLPPGVYHFPFYIKRVGKPITFIEMMLGQKYEKISPQNVRYITTPGDLPQKP
jgi:hypothetical protein